MTNKYGIIILAAGSSTRMGRPKQLLPYKGQSLLRHIVDIAIAAELGPVIVVIGAELKLLEDELKNTRAIIVHNKEWEEGMASSIRHGLNQFTVQFPSAEGVIITVCDQPYITERLLRELVEGWVRNGKKVIASAYDDTMGTPVFFHRDLFPQLMELKGDKGAKQIINDNKDGMALVSFAMGGRDIDTEADYEELLKNQKTQ